jgi:hypothetical protein
VHSLRHTFKTAARGVMGQEWHDALTGHAGASVSNGYGRARSVAASSAWWCSVPDGASAWNASAGGVFSTACHGADAAGGTSAPSDRAGWSSERGPPAAQHAGGTACGSCTCSPSSPAR